MKFFGVGAVWGQDIILRDITLCQEPMVFSLTYAEVLLLRKGQLDKICVQALPEHTRSLRKKAVRLAAQRGIFREAAIRQRLALDVAAVSSRQLYMSNPLGAPDAKWDMKREATPTPLLRMLAHFVSTHTPVPDHLSPALKESVKEATIEAERASVRRRESTLSRFSPSNIASEAPEEAESDEEDEDAPDLTLYNLAVWQGTMKTDMQKMRLQISQLAQVVKRLAACDSRPVASCPRTVAA